MQKSKIEWLDGGYTWNPVSGEKQMVREFPWQKGEKKKEDLTIGVIL